VPVIVMGWTVTAGDREGGVGEACLDGARGFTSSAMLRRDVATDEACEERPDGWWRSEL
jgi:hypothetical protein